MSVHMVQCVCANGHTILGIAWEEGAKVQGAADIVFHTAQDACFGLKSLVEWFIHDHQLNPWCGMCQNRDFRYEDHALPFNTLAEARQFIAEKQLAELRERANADQAKSN